MGITGDIIGGGLGVLGGIFGGAAASKAMKKVRRNTQEQLAKNEAWYNRRYNEDYTQRADAQSLLNYGLEALRSGNRSAAGQQAVAGLSDEQVAQQKAQGNQLMASTMGQIATAAEASKQQVEDSYRNTEQNLMNNLNNMEMQKAGMIGQAVQGMASAGAGIADALASGKNGKQTMA